MNANTLKSGWQRQGEKVFSAVATWRESHPTATMAEIEAEVDEQMNGLRAQMIQDAAQASAAVSGGPARVCESCGKRLQARGRHRRSLQTQGERTVQLERTYVACPHCGSGLFPPG